jgi:hypothetical protein
MKQLFHLSIIESLQISMKKASTCSGLIYFTIIAMMMACSDRKFDKSRWNEKSDANFPSKARQEMLNDLLSNHILVGLKYANVVTLLGSPDGVDSGRVFYKIEIDYGGDIDPAYTKDLYLFTTKDSIIRSYEIKEWGKVR